MNTAQSTKNLAQTLAKQVVNEPWEILRQAGQQVAGTEVPATPNNNGMEKSAAAVENEKFLANRDKIRSQRLLQALETELKERARIRKEKEAKPPPQEIQAPKPLSEISTKPSRKFPRLFGGGKKAQVERQQTQTERPLSPSG